MHLDAPHLGEGIHHMRVVRILKQLDDWVDEDENLLEVETDKMTVEIPSPVRGKISKVFCREDESVKVGSWLLSIDELPEIHGIRINEEVFRNHSTEPKITSAPLFPEKESLSQSQYTLARNLARWQTIVVPATIEVKLPWHYIMDIRRAFRDAVSEFIPSTTEVLAWALIQTMLEFPKLRIRCTDQLEIHQFETARLGIAVALPQDRPETIVVEVSQDADLLRLSRTIREQIRGMKSQSSKTSVPYHSVMLSDMSAMGILRGTPIVVYPSVATLCVGTPYGEKNDRSSICALTFDHRVINGAYAANFMKRMIHLLKEKLSHVAIP